MRHLNVNSGGERLSVMIGSQLKLLRHAFSFSYRGVAILQAKAAFTA
jgi:hypothetical protein